MHTSKDDATKASYLKKIKELKTELKREILHSNNDQSTKSASPIQNELEEQRAKTPDSLFQRLLKGTTTITMPESQNEKSEPSMEQRPRIKLQKNFDISS